MNISNTQFTQPGFTTQTDIQQVDIWAADPRQDGRRMFNNGNIISSAVDAGNTPTTTLRSGLIMGVITSSQLWTTWNSTATDGSEIARGVLLVTTNMLDVFGVAQPRYEAIATGGFVRADRILNLNGISRRQLAQQFEFDDDFPGQYQRVGVPLNEVSVTTTGTLTAGLIAGNRVTNYGATGAQTWTLPLVSEGAAFEAFLPVSMATMFVASGSDKFVTLGQQIATRVGFSTAGAIMGGSLKFFPGRFGNWQVQDLTAGGDGTVTYLTVV